MMASGVVQGDCEIFYSIHIEGRNDLWKHLTRETRKPTECDTSLNTCGRDIIFLVDILYEGISFYLIEAE